MSAYEKRLDVRIGEALRTRREAVGMTQAQLGRAIGVTFQQIQKYERGVNRIAGSKLVIAAEALKCDPAQLFGEPQVDLPGSGRLMRAWSGLDPRQREAVTALVEAFGPEPGDV